MKRIVLLLSCLSLCLVSLFAVMPIRPVHAAGACSNASSTAFGYVTGQAYAASAGIKLGGSASTGPQFLAYLGCDTNQSQDMASVGSLNISPVGTAGTTQSTVTITKGATSLTVNEQSTLANVSLLSGLITANSIQVAATSNGTATTASSSNGSNFGNLTLHVGVVPISVPASPSPNTGFTLPGLGKLVVNEQTITNTADGTTISVNGLDIQVTAPNPFNLPVGGSIIIGHAESKFSRTQPTQTVCGYGYAFNGQATALGDSASSGPWVSARVPAAGGHAQDSLSTLTVPVLGNTGALSITADGQLTPNLDSHVTGT
ncbi:MAG TPA: choice-of-anchor P family protein, partial [Ktedonosporobacter sp.]|nr:choice-of-anchor P family protein [Ktedonosporobacter sp.]